MTVRENLVLGGIGRPAADADRDIERMLNCSLASRSG